MSGLMQNLYERLESAVALLLRGEDVSNARRSIVRLYGEYSEEKRRVRRRMLEVLDNVDLDLAEEFRGLQILGRHLSHVRRHCVKKDVVRDPEARRDCFVTMSHQQTSSLSPELAGEEIANELKRITCPLRIVETLARSLPACELTNLASISARGAIYAIREDRDYNLEVQYRAARPPDLIHYVAITTSRALDAEDIHWQHFEIEHPPRSLEKMSSEVAHCDCRLEYTANMGNAGVLCIGAFNRDLSARGRFDHRALTGRTDAQVLFILSVALGLLQYIGLHREAQGSRTPLPDPSSLVVSLIAADDGSGRLLDYYRKSFGLRARAGSRVMGRLAVEVLRDFIGPWLHVVR
jgi:hypothetical protein